MRSVSASFYKSKVWGDCRKAYITQHPLCERCLQKGLVTPAYIVHHKIHLTPENVNDPSVSLNHDNLESLCFSCHNEEHFTRYKRRWKFVEGEMITTDDESPPIQE